MSNYSDREPQYQDVVKHRKNDTVGTVIAKYMLNGEQYIDVRLDDNVRYSSPAANWEVVRTEEDIV